MLLPTLLIIFSLSLLPPLFSVVGARRAGRRWQGSLQQIRARTWVENRNLELENPSQALLGDPSCRFNARSAYLRCAVNPCGPCQNCGFFEPR